MSDTDTQPTPTPPEPNTASIPDTSQGADAKTEGTNEATFTQADVDRIVSERAKRASESAISKFLEQLGVSNADEAKATIEAEKKRKESEMSDLEKAQAEIESAKQVAEEALAAKTALEAQILANGRKQAFLKAVGNSGGQNADDLFILVQAKHGNDFVSVFGDDSTPDDKKMEAFIKQVQGSFPTYFGSAGAGSPSNAQGVAPNQADFTEEAMKAWRSKLRN